MKFQAWQFGWACVSVLLGGAVGWLTVDTYPDPSWVTEQYQSTVAQLSIVNLERERYLLAANVGASATDTRPITQADVDARVVKEVAQRDEMLAAFAARQSTHVIYGAVKWLALCAGIYLLFWAIAGVVRSMRVT